MISVRDYQPTFRQSPRPEREAPKYWIPRFQAWLSLEELAYLKAVGRD